MMDRNTFARFNESVTMFRSQLSRWLGYSHGGNRDLYSAFGYPREVDAQALYAMYTRNDIATRIIRAFPAATWRDPPLVRDEKGESSEEGTESFSPFVSAVEDFFDKHRLYRVIERADRLASIGRFGILYLGFNDGLLPSQPLQGKAGLIYTQPYSELGVTVANYEDNTASPRFGLPKTYNLSAAAGVHLGHVPAKSITAHWSRVIHLSEFLDQDDVYGLPRLLPVYNRLKDLEKVVGGAAETFWLAADRGIALWADKEAEFSEADRQKMVEQAQEYQDKLRRVLIGQGMTAQNLGTVSPDPEMIATVLLDLIAGSVGIPKRILLGTERGELASTQDENGWSTRVKERRNNFATPSILQPLVSKLIETGNLPEPQGTWWVEWPDTETQDPVAESQVMLNKTSALATYSNSPGAALVVPPQEFRQTFLKMEPESEYELEIPEDLPEEPEDGSEEPEDGQVDPSAGDSEGEEERQPEANSEAKSLYVSRKVLNVKSIAQWAKSQGLTAQDGLHVTVMYSKRPVDWVACGQAFGEDDNANLMIHPGGARAVSRLGGELFKKGDAIVLEFASEELQWRHRMLTSAGAKHSYAKFKPHVTLCYDEAGMIDVKSLEPYQGAIALGPEVFEEVKED